VKLQLSKRWNLSKRYRNDTAFCTCICNANPYKTSYAELLGETHITRPHSQEHSSQVQSTWEGNGNATVSLRPGMRLKSLSRRKRLWGVRATGAPVRCSSGHESGQARSAFEFQMQLREDAEWENWIAGAASLPICVLERPRPCWIGYAAISSSLGRVNGYKRWERMVHWR